MTRPSAGRWEWLKLKQNTDGGWGESNDTYAQAPADRQKAASTAYQSAWALLGLLAAGEARSDSARRAAEFLNADSNRQWSVERCELHGPGFSPGFLLKISRLFSLFSAVGAVGIPDSRAPRNRPLIEVGVGRGAGGRGANFGSPACGGLMGCRDWLMEACWL